MRLNSDMSLNLHPFSVYGISDGYGKSTQLHRLDCHTVISTNIKCADPFDLFFTLNQAKLDKTIGMKFVIYVNIIIKITLLFFHSLISTYP